MMSSLTSNNSGSHNASTEIKGGGRAILTEETEAELVDCLMRRRARRQDAGDAAAVLPKNDHQAQVQRKRFVKQLLASYERQRIHQQINRPSSTSLEKETGNISHSTSSKTFANGSKNKESLDMPVTTGKVRVELVVAREDLKSKSKSKQAKSKKLVLARSITIPQLLQQAKTKLGIKEPKRVYVMMDGKKSGRPLQVDLTTNLAGIVDDTMLYVSSNRSTTAAEAAGGNDSGDAISSQDGEKLSNDEDQNADKDLLEAVKQAYIKQGRRNHRQAAASNRKLPFDLPIVHPNFSDHFKDLPPLNSQSSSLPAANSRNEILQAVQDHRVVIICGATGSGKSTQVPQFLWQALKHPQPSSPYANIVVTQPRRVAATSLARRVASEMNSPALGTPQSIVGHHVRLDRATSDHTEILFCTVGILLRQLVMSSSTTTKNNPIPLADVTHLIIDEVHERDVQTDFVLTLLKGVVLKQNPQIRVILMSATASVDLFSKYFEAYEPVILSIPGRTFPVETKWIGDCQKLASKQIRNYHEEIDLDASATATQLQGEPRAITLSPKATDPIDNSFIEMLIASIITRQHQETPSTQSNGAILVFLPGKGEIEALFRILTRTDILRKIDNDYSIKIHKLHSGVPRGDQQSIFETAPSNTVKIVLATNIAETSITIPDVSHVIDTGRVKESRYNAATRIKELVTIWTSQASAAQRAGRAGRTSNGVCYKLYSESFCKTHMPAQTSPEIVRTPLDELILQVFLLYEQKRDRHQQEQQQKGSSDSNLPANFPRGANPASFLSQVPEPPPLESVEQACSHLLDVGAIEIVDAASSSLYRLTPLGFHLSRLPMDAKVGKVLIVGCILGCIDGALTVAASLSSAKSCFFHKFQKSIMDQEHERAKDRRDRLIEKGFGGKDWGGGTVKGDLIAAIACYREWKKCPKDKDRYEFSRDHALDHVAMREIDELRSQYLSLLQDAGFATKPADGKGKGKEAGCNHHKDDAMLTSCCLVAGLYPNVCTLMRPRKGGPKGGRLLTKEGDICRPQVNSFQRSRVQRAAESGKDAYAVYHTKHRSVGTQKRAAHQPSPAKSLPGEVLLSEVNFISRYALLLFGGDLEIVKNAVIVDGWLKFKIGEKATTGAVLLLCLRQELDESLLLKVTANSESENDSDDTIELLDIVRKLLADE